MCQLCFCRALAGQQCCWFTVRSQQHGVFSTCVRNAGSVKYIWPLQTALSDFGAKRKRLDAIRSEPGWPIVGCKYVECYSKLLAFQPVWQRCYATVYVLLCVDEGLFHLSFISVVYLLPRSACQ